MFFVTLRYTNLVHRTSLYAGSRHSMVVSMPVPLFDDVYTLHSRSETSYAMLGSPSQIQGQGMTSLEVVSRRISI